MRYNKDVIMPKSKILLLIIITLFAQPLFVYAQNSPIKATTQLSNKVTTNKPAIQQGSVYHPIDDISQYWVSEKLDGVRGYWNGKHLITRNGTMINTPDWFTKHWPKNAMDGELWIARGKFEQVSSIVRQHNALASDWRQVHFMIFDLPNASGDFSARIKQMQSIVLQVNSPYLNMIKQEKFPSTKHLFEHLDKIISQNGEGLMLHHQHAFYQPGRVKHLMKLKRYQDAEAIVIEHIAGKGKFKNMLGALRVKNNEGIIFKIGSGFTNQQRQSPPAIGSQITYKFFGKTKNNVPRFASFMRKREIL